MKVAGGRKIVIEAWEDADDEDVFLCVGPLRDIDQVTKHVLVGQRPEGAPKVTLISSDPPLSSYVATHEEWLKLLD